MKDFFKNSEIQNMFIRFAKNLDRSKISILVDENKIELRELKHNDFPVGINIADFANCYDEPCLQLIFHSIESINVMIKALENVKSNIITDSQPTMAC